MTRDEPVDGDGAEEHDVQQSGATDPEPLAQGHRRQHGEQDAAEHEGVDEPGGAEEQGELHDVLRLQEQERRSHAHQVEVRRHRAQGTAGNPDGDEREPEDEGDGDDVEAGNAGSPQVRKRVVVGRRRRRRRRRRERLAGGHVTAVASALTTSTDRIVPRAALTHGGRSKTFCSVAA